jgi:hypothetical protein
MRFSKFSIATLLVIAGTLWTPAVIWARGGGGGGGGHGGGAVGGGGHFAGGYHGGARYAGWGGRGYGWGYRGYGWGGRGYGWGYPYYGYGFGLGLGLGYGLGYGGYGGWGYGYPNYGYYGYYPYSGGYAASPVVPYSGGYAPSSAVPYAAPAGPPQVSASPVSTASAASGPVLTEQDSESARELAGKGDAAFQAADYSGAAYAYRHALVDDPHDAVVTLRLGLALFATGSYSEAAGATQAALRQLSRNQWGAVVSRYQDLYGDTHDYTRQLRNLEAELKAHPSDPALRFLAGYHYGYLGFRKQALDQLDKGLSLAPRDEIMRELRDELRNKSDEPREPPPAPRAPFFNYEEN